MEGVWALRISGPSADTNRIRFKGFGAIAVSARLGTPRMPLNVELVAGEGKRLRLATAPQHTCPGIARVSASALRARIAGAARKA